MYLLSIICVIVVTGGMCVIGFGMAGSYLGLVDVYTFLFLLLFLIPLLISGGLLKDFNNAFRLVIGKKKAASLIELKRAKESVSLTIKILLTASVFINAVEGVLVLLNVDDLAFLGPNFSVTMIAFIYGFGIILILLPLQSRLNIKIQEFISEKE